MSKFELDISKYEVEVVKQEIVDNKVVTSNTTEEYPLCGNLAAWLRGVGVFRSAEDVAEAVMLGKRLLSSDELECVILDDREAEVLKKCVNRLVELTADDKASVGGPVHEEAIIRVVKMEEVTS